MKREGGGGEGGEGGLYGTAILHSCQKEFCRQFVYLDARKMLSRRKFFNHQMDLVQIIYKNTIIYRDVKKPTESSVRNFVIRLTVFLISPKWLISGRGYLAYFRKGLPF